MQPHLNRFCSIHGRVLQCALPDDRYAPAESMEHLRMAPVSSDICLEFLPPEIFIGLGSGCVAAAFMSVPEAAMDEHHRSVLREYKVGRAGQSPYMKSISKTSGEKERAKYPFRLGVLSANARHHATALRSGRNAHGLDHLRSECLRELRRRSFRVEMRTDEDYTRSSNLELTVRLILEKTQGGANGS